MCMPPCITMRASPHQVVALDSEASVHVHIEERLVVEKVGAELLAVVEELRAVR